ncbi:MAG: acyl carrier protein [Candidatus Scalinduaceae bacterium]
MNEVTSNIEDRIKKVIEKRLIVHIDARQISRDTPLIGKGLGLDSITLQELVVGLEKEFNIFIDESEMRIEVFENIGSLAKYISKELNSE